MEDNRLVGKISDITQAKENYMSINIGIPRAMLYHDFGRLWRHFFDALGEASTLSGETTKQHLDRGTSLAVDESCLPLKIYLGHVETLLPGCSHILVPRITRYHPGFYHCAKLAGLPDIVRNTFRLSADRIIAPNIETNGKPGIYKAAASAAAAAGHSRPAGCLALRRALATWRGQPAADAAVPMETGKKVAVIGHSYLLKDSFLCGDILAILKARAVTVLTPADLDNKLAYNEARRLSPDIYWQLPAKTAGAACHFAGRPDIAGLILVSSFGCGLDSMMNEYLEHRVLRPSNKPYLIISLDEHTGRAGVATRVEAFWDLVEWRQKP